MQQKCSMTTHTFVQPQRCIKLQHIYPANFFSYNDVQCLLSDFGLGPGVDLIFGWREEDSLNNLGGSFTSALRARGWPTFRTSPPIHPVGREDAASTDVDTTYSFRRTLSASIRFVLDTSDTGEDASNIPRIPTSANTGLPRGLSGVRSTPRTIDLSRAFVSQSSPPLTHPVQHTQNNTISFDLVT